MLKILNRRKRNVVFSSILLSITLTQIAYAQDDTLYDSREYINNNSIGVQLKAGVLPGADFDITEGTYHLKSRLQSSFSIGMNYQTNLDHSWGINWGLHINLTKRNFFIHIPDSDLNGYLSSQGAPQIEDKDIYLRLVIPFRVIHKFLYNDHGFWDLKAGLNLNYSGFSNDEIITASIADTNYQSRNIFYGEFKSNNNNKPWVTFSLSSSKNLFLKNNNQISFEIFLELSKTDFLKGNYEITIPGKPVTRGTYSVSGSCAGFAIQYTFTGTNKRRVNGYHQSPF